MKQEIIKRNIIFILLMGIEGAAFGLIDWDSVISDLVYLKYNNKVLISIITANVGLAKLISTLICIYLNDSNKPNKIFLICVILSTIGSLLIGITYNLGWVILFALIYMIQYIIIEVFSGYHYAYVYNSLPDEMATKVHAKRISIFKITFMLGIGVASFFTTRYIETTMSTITIMSAVIFALLIFCIMNVKNIPKNKKKNIQTLKEKLNLKRYTNYYKVWLLTRFLGKFALSSLVVLTSMIIIDKNVDLIALKSFKTGAWFFSAFGFWISSYLTKNSILVKGDIICKLLIAISLIISFFNPYLIYIIILLNGLLNPFNTMSDITMLQKDTDNISVVQKELIIKLVGYISAMLSSYILLNINTTIAISIIIITLVLSVIIELKLYNKIKVEE